MDRRTVLAFVLIGLILVLMPYYMRWVYGDKYDTIQVDPVEQFERVEPGTRTRASSVPVGEREKVSPEILTADKSALKFADSDAAPAFVPKEILVDTEHFQAVLSSRGGVITSWKLKSYFTKAGDWLELLPSGGYGLSVSVGLESLDLLEFVPSDTRLTLSGSEQADLILRAETAYGIVEKRVRFQGDRYHFQLMVSVAGLPREADIGVRWHGALADTEELGRPAGGFYEDNYEYVVTYAGGEVEIWDLARIQDDEEPPSSS